MTTAPARRRPKTEEEETRTGRAAWGRIYIGEDSMMGMTLRDWGKSIARRSLLAMTFVFPACTAVCHAQWLASTCMPTNDISFEIQGPQLSVGGVLPGHSYTVSITGGYSIGMESSGCPNVWIAAYDLVRTPYYDDFGAPNPYVTLSDLKQESSTLTTFTLTVAAGAPSEDLYLMFNTSAFVTGVGQNWYYWIVSIEPLIPPPTPPAPVPPPTSNFNCLTPTINSVDLVPPGVSPGTWVAGKTYPIVITGANFTTETNPPQSCPATQVTVTAGSRSLPLSEIKVVNSTTITATIAPAASEPTEAACVALSGPPASVDVDVKAAGNAKAMTANSTAMDASAMPTEITGSTCNGTAGSYTAVTYRTQILNPNLYIINPNELSPDAQGNSVIATLPTNPSPSGHACVSGASTNNPANCAAGLIADGTSTGIAVFGPVDPNQDVNLSVVGGNGVTLAPWNSSFLKIKPDPSNGTSLTVTPTQYSSGGQYYALALVQAPSRNIASSLTYKFAVKAEQATDSSGDDTASDSQNLLVSPPVVILIHGIWGNNTSLTGPNSVYNYLDVTARYPSNWVQPICYSSLIPWNAQATGVNPNGGCNGTSMDAIYFALQGVYRQYDQSNLVGGRVDIVAHSMGGLASMNYGAQGDYLYQYRDRYQGAIHQLITIDSPVGGSLLSNYLMKLAPRMFNKYNGDVLALIAWNKAGCEDWTLEQCLALKHMPLAAPGASPITGALYSLSPEYVNGAPHTPPRNTTWAPIVGSFPTNPSPPYSVLRLVVHELAANVYSSDETMPELSCVLQNLDNDACKLQLHNLADDVIVTAASQWAGSSISFPADGNLQHTETPDVGDFLSIFPGLSDDNVLHSDAVDNLVLYNLQNCCKQ